jgi:glutamine synthetase
MANSQKNIDYVLRTVEERDIRFIRLWFTDVSGNLKSFAISPEDLEEAFDEGIGFDGSAVDGFASVSESDMLAFPDATTFQILPWRPTEKGVARIFCDIKTPKREPFHGDPRNCLRRIFRYAEKRGFIPNVGPQIEYFYFKGEHEPVPLDSAGYFDLTPGDSARDLRRSTVLGLENLSIPVEYSYHALAPSQHGLSLRYAEALSCADNLITARLVVKQMAFEDGAYASFMPKPLQGQPGSSMFLHQSLFDNEGNNIFWGPNREAFHLSEYAHSYIAGLIKYAPEYCLVTNPTVNSYKRLVPSVNVPTYATWGRKNRAALVRIPLHKPGKHASTRVELRLPDASCNPYLAIAATVAAGLKGIDEKLELPEEYEGGETEQELASKGCVRLPRTLGEALDNFRESSLMREVLGDHIFEFMVEQKEREWFEYNSSVTDWELERYYAGF